MCLFYGYSIKKSTATIGYVHFYKMFNRKKKLSKMKIKIKYISEKYTTSLVITKGLHTILFL